MIVRGVRGGDGVDRNASEESAATDELEDIVERVRCRSWLDRLENFSVAEGWTGRVALDATDDVDVRRSCL